MYIFAVCQLLSLCKCPFINMSMYPGKKSIANRFIFEPLYVSQLLSELPTYIDLPNVGQFGSFFKDDVNL